MASCASAKTRFSVSHNNVTSLLLGGHVDGHSAVGWPREDVVADNVRRRLVHLLRGLQFLVHAIVEIRVLRSRAVSASRSHQLQGSQCLTTASVPALSLKKSCTQSLKSMCLRSRTVSALNHQFRGPKYPSVPGRDQQCERTQPLCGVLPRGQLRGRCRARLKINGKAMRAV